MYVFSGRTYNLNVDFKVGAELIAPTAASFKVVDRNSEVFPDTALSLAGNPESVWITIPSPVNVLTPGENFRQHRVEVEYIHNGVTFTNYYSYFIVQDLFLEYTAKSVKQAFGLSDIELDDEDVDFYRTYIDFCQSAKSQPFLDAISNNDANVKFLIFYQTLMNILPTLRLRALTSIESDSSKMGRAALTDKGLALLEASITERYRYYYDLVLNPTSASFIPTLLITDSPVDPITGV